MTGAPRTVSAGHVARWSGVIGLCLLGAATSAHAESWQIQPAVSAQESYDDNPRLLPGEKQSVFATSASGALELSRLTEIEEVRGLVRLDGTTYSGSTRGLRDKVQALARLRAFRKGELSRWGGELSYRRDDLLETVQVVLNPQDVTVTPDDTVDTALVRQSVTRNRLIIQPQWSRHLTSRWSVGAQYRYYSVGYDQTEGTGLVEYTDNRVKGTTSYNVTELDSASLSLEASRYDAAMVDRVYDSYTLLGGYEHKFTELMRGGIEAGISHVNINTETQSGSEDGYIVRLTGTKLTGLTRFGLRMGHELYPSGSGDVVQTDEAVFNMYRKITQLMSFSLRTRLYETKSLRRDNPDANRRYLTIDAGLHKKLTRWWTVEGAYRYRRQKRDIDPQSGESNALLVSVKYTRPTAVGDLFGQ